MQTKIIFPRQSETKVTLQTQWNFLLRRKLIRQFLLIHTLKKAFDNILFGVYSSTFIYVQQISLHKLVLELRHNHGNSLKQPAKGQSFRVPLLNCKCSVIAKRCRDCGLSFASAGWDLGQRQCFHWRFRQSWLVSYMFCNLKWSI